MLNGLSSAKSANVSECLASWTHTELLVEPVISSHDGSGDGGQREARPGGSDITAEFPGAFG